MKKLIKVLLTVNFLSVGVFGIQQVANHSKTVQAVDQVIQPQLEELPYEN